MQHADQEEGLQGRQSSAVGSVCKKKHEEMEERKHGGMEGWREGQGLSKRRGRKASWLQVIQR